MSDLPATPTLVIVELMQLALIVHDVRSCHNVGSLLRTADGLGVEHVYLTGYTPYPNTPDDKRLPHISDKITRQIHKTALGAETSVEWSHHEDVELVINQLKADGYLLAALEQSADSLQLAEFRTDADKLALLLGREVEGIDDNLLSKADIVLEIPMLGAKESLNVVQAAAIALFQLRYHSAK